MSNTSSLGTALITGASSGIGAVYADRLARRGYDLILVARSASKLAELADGLRTRTGRRIDTLVADLTAADDVRRVEAVLRDNTAITLLVNNAGAAAVTPLLQSSSDDMEAMIALNVTALTRLTYAAAPGFVARGHGAIVNIASIVALAPTLLNGVYGASKAFVLAFGESLRHELADQGVRVHTVLPGATATNLWSSAGMSVEQLPADIVMQVDDMVDAALAGFDQGEPVTIPSLPDIEDWNRYESARLALGPNLSRREAAARYRGRSGNAAFSA